MHTLATLTAGHVIGLSLCFLSVDFSQSYTLQCSSAKGGFLLKISVEQLNYLMEKEESFHEIIMRYARDEQIKILEQRVSYQQAQSDIQNLSHQLIATNKRAAKVEMLKPSS